MTKKNPAAVALGKRSHEARTKGMSETQIADYYKSLRQGKKKDRVIHRQK